MSKQSKNRNRGQISKKPAASGALKPDNAEPVHPAAPRKVDVSVEQRYERRTFSGPVPPPYILAEYNEVDPSFAERIMVMTEKQAEHRRSLESTVVKSEIRRSWGGLICGFVIALAGLAVAAYLAVNDKQTTASIVGGGTLVSLVGVFVYGSHVRRQERKARNESLAKAES